MRKIIILLFAWIIALDANSQKKSSSEYARELLEVSGAEKMSIQMMNQMVASFKNHYSSVPNEFWDEFIKEAKTDELFNLIIPVYVKHYTDEEMKQLIEFFKSPLGKKMVEKMPLIAQDSYSAGEKWGQAVGERVAKKLKEKGYVKE